MDDLIKQVSERAGISADQAGGAVKAVLDFLKNKLPGPIAAQLDNFVNQPAGEGGGLSLGGMVKNVGGMFGKS